MIRSSPPLEPRTGRLLAAAILFWTFALSLFWSHSKPFWVDELLEYFSDAKPSAVAVLSGQLYSPFSLEPPLFHLIEHAALLIAPAHPEFLSRIVSMLSLLITEFCVYVITRRLGRSHGAALLAMCLPLLFVTADYAVEARVYSMLTALFAVALLSWQVAIEPRERSRRLALTALFVSLTLAILCHYYGLFLPLPLLVGELIRSLRRRKLDPAVLLALLLPLAFFALNRPFMAPLHEIQAHYYDSGETRWRQLPLTYLWLVIGFKVYDPTVVGTHLVLLSCLASAALFAVLFWRIALPWRRQRLSHQRDMEAALLAAVCLPTLNFLVAHFVTHAYMLRYGLPAIVALSILLVLALPVRLAWAGYAILGAAVLFTGTVRTKRASGRQHWVRKARLETFADRTGVDAALARTPDPHIYLQDVTRFLTLWFYAPPDLRARMVYVQSAGRELHWLGHTTTSIFARNIGRTTPLSVIRFEALQQMPGPHLFVIDHDPREEWIEQEISAEPIDILPAGKGLDGDLELLTIRPSPAMPR